MIDHDPDGVEQVVSDIFGQALDLLLELAGVLALEALLQKRGCSIIKSSIIAQSQIRVKRIMESILMLVNSLQTQLLFVGLVELVKEDLVVLVEVPVNDMVGVDEVLDLVLLLLLDSGLLGLASFWVFAGVFLPGGCVGVVLEIIVVFGGGIDSRDFEWEHVDFYVELSIRVHIGSVSAEVVAQQSNVVDHERWVALAVAIVVEADVAQVEFLNVIVWMGLLDCCIASIIFIRYRHVDLVKTESNILVELLSLVMPVRLVDLVDDLVHFLRVAVFGVPSHLLIVPPSLLLIVEDQADIVNSILSDIQRLLVFVQIKMNIVIFFLVFEGELHDVSFLKDLS